MDFFFFSLFPRLILKDHVFEAQTSGLSISTLLMRIRRHITKMFRLMRLDYFHEYANLTKLGASDFLQTAWEICSSIS